MKDNKRKYKTIVSAKDFVNLGADGIVKIMKNDKSLAIIGSERNVDLRIVKRLWLTKSGQNK